MIAIQDVDFESYWLPFLVAQSEFENLLYCYNVHYRYLSITKSAGFYNILKVHCQIVNHKRIL
jgi:hypothetical protein